MEKKRKFGEGAHLSPYERWMQNLESQRDSNRPKNFASRRSSVFHESGKDGVRLRELHTIHGISMDVSIKNPMSESEEEGSMAAIYGNAGKEEFYGTWQDHGHSHTDVVRASIHSSISSMNSSISNPLTLGAQLLAIRGELEELAEEGHDSDESLNSEIGVTASESQCPQEIAEEDERELEDVPRGTSDVEVELGGGECDDDLAEHEGGNDDIPLHEPASGQESERLPSDSYDEEPVKESIDEGVDLVPPPAAPERPDPPPPRLAGKSAESVKQRDTGGTVTHEDSRLATRERVHLNGNLAEGDGKNKMAAHYHRIYQPTALGLLRGARGARRRGAGSEGEADKTDNRCRANWLKGSITRRCCRASCGRSSFVVH
jgi:hypothetical protein